MQAHDDAKQGIRDSDSLIQEEGQVRDRTSAPSTFTSRPGVLERPRARGNESCDHDVRHALGFGALY